MKAGRWRQEDEDLREADVMPVSCSVSIAKLSTDDRLDQHGPPRSHLHHDPWSSVRLPFSCLHLPTKGFPLLHATLRITRDKRSRVR